MTSAGEPICARSNASPTDPNLTLELWSRAGDVVVVRQALAAIAEVLELSGPDVADIATVLTEACNNVVVHAYPPDEPGPLNVEFAFAPGLLVVTVSDLGCGIAAHHEEPRAGGGRLGIPMMVALARSVEFSDPGQRGTRVQFTFDVGRVESDLLLDRPAWTRRPQLAEDHIAAGGAIVTASPGRLAAVALARVARVLAGRARFTAAGLEDVDRVSRQIAREVAAEGPHRALTCGIVVAPRSIELCTFARLTSIEGDESAALEVSNETGITRAMLGAR